MYNVRHAEFNRKQPKMTQMSPRAKMVELDQFYLF